MELASEVLERPGTGLAEEEQERAFFVAMEGASLTLLSDMPGIGAASKTRLLAAFEIGRRYARYRSRVLSPPASRAPGSGDLRTDAVELIPAEWRGDSQEWLGFVPIYKKRGGFRAGSPCRVERGVRTHVNVDPVELFARILSLRPQGFFLFHNHPSGDLSPSEADLELTRQVAEVGRQLGTRLLGHGIVSASDARWIER